MKLTIELVPKSSWYSNVRSNVTELEWNRIKQHVNKAAGYRCEICGGRGKKWPTECHEIFSYDDFLSIQKLEKIVALCPPCHHVKHIGLAQIKGYFDHAVRHFCKVNEVGREEALTYIDDQFALWRRRSRQQWKLNLKYLNQFLQWESK